MMKYGSMLLLLMGSLGFFSGCSTPEKYDLLKEKGSNEEYRESATFPFDKVFQKEKNGWLVKAPEEKLLRFKVTLHPLELDAGGIYKFSLRYTGREEIRMLMHNCEYSGKQYRFCRPLMSTMSYLNVNGETLYEKEFALSPGSTSIIPSLDLSHKKSLPPNLLWITECSITRVGTMKKACAQLKKINFAEEHNFKKHPEGVYKKMLRGWGEKAAKWSNVDARVVVLDGSKVLRIKRKKENYIYPHLNFTKFPVDPRYYFVRVTLQAKGKGAFTTGLWWKRKSLGFDYENCPVFKLNDQWQTISIVRPCLSPDVESAALSFTSSGEGEFFIRNISVTLE